MNLKAVVAALNAIKLAGAPVISLSAESPSEGEVTNAIVTLGAKLTELNSKLDEKQTKITELENEITNLTAAQSEEKATNLVELALNAGKITAGEKESYIELAKVNYDHVKKILDTKQAYKPATERINQQDAQEKDSLLKLSWDEADQQGKLAEIKANHEDHFKSLYKEKFGKTLDK